ncbi:hypothetical protein LPJ57_002963, partial [Coemansia sp. RSA 486]
MSIREYDSHYRTELAATRRQQRVGSKHHTKIAEIGGLKLRLKDTKIKRNREEEPFEEEEEEEEGELRYQTSESSLPTTPDSGVRRSNRKRTQRVLVNIPPMPDHPLTAPPIMERQQSNLRSKRRVSSVSSAGSKTRKRKPTSGESSRNNSCDPPVLDRSQTPVQDSSSVECFICHRVLEGDMDAINEHIDACLLQPLEASSVASHETTSEDGPVVMYEWSGQTRVRATAMLEGGPAQAGLGYGSSGQMVGRDEDVDVDAEDETNFGIAQYTDADLIFASASGSNSKNYVGAAPQWEETPLPLDMPGVAAAAHAADAARGGSSGALQLVVDALKARIQEQDRLLRTVKKCTICLESYDQPCVSVNCWHVYCEKCWLHTLGSKKL